MSKLVNLFKSEMARHTDTWKRANSLTTNATGNRVHKSSLRGFQPRVRFITVSTMDSMVTTIKCSKRPVPCGLHTFQNKPPNLLLFVTEEWLLLVCCYPLWCRRRRPSVFPHLGRRNSPRYTAMTDDVTSAARFSWLYFGSISCSYLKPVTCPISGAYIQKTYKNSLLRHVRMSVGPSFCKKCHNNWIWTGIYQFT